MATKTYQGSCHCGRVKFEADVDVRVAGTSKCNCTSCWKKRMWNTKVAPESFRPLSGQEELSGYKPGQASGHGGFCKTCGVFTYSFVPKTEWNPNDYYAVAVAALDNLEPAELLEAPVQFCDGRANNWWNPPAETRHL
jgi:hypothetical protein